MAACGGIEHIFEKPLSESPPNFLEALSPWKHIEALKQPNIDDSSFTEIFGELHFKENHVHNNPPPPSSPSSNTTTGEISAIDQERERDYYPSSQRKQQYKHNQSFSSDSLSLCTEGLGLESFDDVEETSSHDEFSIKECQHGDGERNVARNSHSDQRSEVGRVSRAAAFPPPISCIGRSGKPWVCFKSYREHGRFVLQEVRIPTQEFLHACREDGRLQLHFVQSDDEEQDKIEAEAVDEDKHVEEHNQELAE